MLVLLSSLLPLVSCHIMQPELWSIQLPFKSAANDLNPSLISASASYTNVLLTQALKSPCSKADDCAKYVTLSDDGVLHLSTPGNGTHTSGSPHPRTELPQIVVQNGVIKKANFSELDTNTMLTTVSVDTPTGVSVAQVFFLGNSTKSDAPWGIVNTTPNADGTGLVYFHVNDRFRTTLDSQYQYTQKFQINITVSNKIIYVGYSNLDSGVKQSTFFNNGEGNHYFGFKTGSYCQVIADPTNDRDSCHVSIYDLQVFGPCTTHSHAP